MRDWHSEKTREEKERKKGVGGVGDKYGHEGKRVTRIKGVGTFNVGKTLGG
jgi:hypothetical protein